MIAQNNNGAAVIYFVTQFELFPFSIELFSSDVGYTEFDAWFAIKVKFQTGFYPFAKPCVEMFSWKFGGF